MGKKKTRAETLGSEGCNLAELLHGPPSKKRKNVDRFHAASENRIWNAVLKFGGVVESSVETLDVSERAQTIRTCLACAFQNTLLSLQSRRCR